MSVAQLKNMMIFSDLSDSEIDILVSRMERVLYAEGEKVFSEGEEGDTLYVILDGQIRTSVLLADGQELILATIEKGNFFGEMAIIENAPRSASCRAAANSELLRLQRNDFDDIIRQHPDMALKILSRMMGIMAKRFNATGAALSEMVRWGEGARKRAVTDEFTGLYNRRFFDESFGTHVARALGAGKSLSFIMIDMDHFGKINKKYGEAFADKVILAAVKIFRESFREKDILARYGGDEFSFLLPDTGSNHAKELCNAMMQRVRKESFPEHPEFKLTLSVGIAAVPENADAPSALKEAADKALYIAKENGRDRAEIAPAEKARTLETIAAKSSPAEKTDIYSIAEKNRIVKNISEEIFNKDSFLLLGHIEPDADCVSSLVAFALLLSKFGKEVMIFLIDPVIPQLAYLLAICKYNAINVIEDINTDIPNTVSAVVVIDTPKQEMIRINKSIAHIMANPNIRKIEIDHHLGSDARYIGDRGYRLVFNASSSCEIIGFLCLKLFKNPATALSREEFFSRNLALSILTGIVDDSQMGKYLKTKKERWYYRIFSSVFNRLLSESTSNSGKNLRSMENIFDVIQNFSQYEQECYNAMKAHIKSSASICSIILGEAESGELFRKYEKEIIVNVSKSATNELSEKCGKLGLVAYYDPPRLSDLIQFRLRRSSNYTTLDLRDVIAQLGITNGGGHPGAVGFRISKTEVSDIEAYGEKLISQIEEIIAESERDQ